MEPQIVEIYDRNFREKQIDDMLHFYKTETGQEILKKMPIIVQESIEMSQDYVENILPKIREISKDLQNDLETSRDIKK